MANQLKNIKGQGVLITRPIAQAAALKKQVFEMGGIPYVFPTLEISYISAAELQPKLEQIEPGQILVFVSVNAVKGVVKAMTPHIKRLLSTTSIAAVGKRTQAALEAENMQVSIIPDESEQTTEGLLKHPALQNLQGQKVTIVRAQSGRETLREELQARGAQVEYLQAYQSTIPDHYNAVPMLQALRSGDIQFVLLSSYAAFANLLMMLGSQAETLLKPTCLIVPSVRVAGKIQVECGARVVVAKGASNEVMLDAIGTS